MLSEQHPGPTTRDRADNVKYRQWWSRRPMSTMDSAGWLSTFPDSLRIPRMFVEFDCGFRHVLKWTSAFGRNMSTMDTISYHNTQDTGGKGLKLAQEHGRMTTSRQTWSYENDVYKLFSGWNSCAMAMDGDRTWKNAWNAALSEDVMFHHRESFKIMLTCSCIPLQPAQLLVRLHFDLRNVLQRASAQCEYIPSQRGWVE